MLNLDGNQIREFVERNPQLVKAKLQSNGLYVLKYTNKVFYRDLWTPELRECRGTVVDADYNVIQRPFTKVFNLHERGTRIHRDAVVVAPTKVNGFMAALTFYQNELLVSTTGSCDSDYAKLAYTVLSNTGAFQLAADYGSGITWIFEICDPSDPHIITETPGAYLLGARRTQWLTPQHLFNEAQLDGFAASYGLMRPEWYRMRFGDVVKMNKTVDHEGFICYTPNGAHELKLKSPKYLVTKFLARIKGDNLISKLETDPQGIKMRVDEEFYPLIDYIHSIKLNFASLDEQARISVVNDFFENELS